MPRKESYKLDKSKEYSHIRGSKTQRRYQQDGRYFDHYGEYLGDNPDRPKEKSVTPSKPQAAKVSPDQERKEALKKASAKLGAAPVPQELQDAAKENAQALAAEDNA